MSDDDYLQHILQFSDKFLSGITEMNVLLNGNKLGQ